MPEILEAYDRHMEARRISQAQIAFAKDVARQCVAIDIRQKSMPKMVIRNGCVMTESQEKHYDLLIEKATS